MTTPLTLAHTRRTDGTPALIVGGEIDMSNAGEFAAALSGTGDGTVLVVDLTDVGYIDSAGLTVLFDNTGHIEVVANPLIAPVLAISGLGDLITVHGLDAGPDGGPAAGGLTTG
ncbi:anti-anti-sigma factor [Sphaerisporangium rufum]|uniref:Anti-anti-sigma factor n=1 Tax=Sphaerisporangium rufum TaxID=1381558 RepID=A0A919R244_9ACTN|nr:STAS domain-containing protein [Sphaerisporangium rufum]GII76996.1 anti-anti-sigma factor [Sphaerisporangium rufum]